MVISNDDSNDNEIPLILKLSEDLLEKLKKEIKCNGDEVYQYINSDRTIRAIRTKMFSFVDVNDIKIPIRKNRYPIIDDQLFLKIKNKQLYQNETDSCLNHPINQTIIIYLLISKKTIEVVVEEICKFQ